MNEPTIKMFKVVIAVTRSTSRTPKHTMSRQAAPVRDTDVLFEALNNAGVVTLNRPNVLNVLNMSMAQKLLPQLQEWERSKALVIVKGAGEKAFCAGGDLMVAVDKAVGPKFARTEYNINYLIGQYKIPYVAFINGIAMGGGIGLSVHGKYRVATENALIAMPETKVGLIPDVGGTYFLPRLQGNLGLYLGLTGKRLRGKDVVKAGIATHFVQSKRLYELEQLLSRCSGDAEVQALLGKFSEPPEEFSLADNIRHINYCFAASTVEEIIERLEKVKNDWSVRTLQTMSQMSPTAMKLTLRALHRGAQLELPQCLKMEFRLACRNIKAHDFPEGVRALLVDKDNNPKWNPKSLANVDEEVVETFFKELPEDQELQFFNA